MSSQTSISPEVYLTPAEVAVKLQLSPRTLANWRSLRKGPAFIPGGRIRYTQSTVDAWMKAQEVEAA